MPSISPFLRLIAACAILASCTPIIDQRGHTDQADYSQIVVGQSNEEDVQAILGTPSAKSNFGDNTWYYISERKETVGMLAPEVVAQQVTAVTFNASGMVEDIDKTGKKNARMVEYVERTTPTEGRKLTAMEQLMGNFGRFSAPGREIDPRNLNR